MNRDHMMGYAPAAMVSAECPHYEDEFAIFDYERYPLGTPTRLRTERLARWDAEHAARLHLNDFERFPHPNPDGTFTPVRPGATFAKKAESDGPVTQAADYSYSEEHAPVVVADWRALPAQQAVPLSALVPREVMRIDARGEMHMTWFADGNHYFVNGREVSREEYLRAQKSSTPPEVDVAASIRSAFDQCKPGGAAQQLLGRQLQSLQDRAQAVVDRVKTPMRNDLLAQALQKANEDPSIRERWTKRVKEINADLKQEAQSKGDGGIAMPEIDAGKLARLEAMSIPIRINYVGPYDSGFDFPPNA
jgi:hypothetical protein